jgi:hypothetical protein
VPAQAISPVVTSSVNLSNALGVPIASAVRAGAALAIRSQSDGFEIGKEWRDAMIFRRILVFPIHFDLNSNNSVINSLNDCYRETQGCSK